MYGIGNPGPIPQRQPQGRQPLQQLTGSVDADTGKLKWHYQFTPHDVHDWDATEVPTADLLIGGQTRSVMFANRNGFTTRSIAQ
jgi:alcohol dehydrogenase (cytochrome c)